MLRNTLLLFTFIAFMSFANEDAYIIDSMHVDSSESNQLPRRSSQILFDNASNQIMISGNYGSFDSPDRNLYIWQYEEGTNDVSFLGASSFGYHPDLVLSGYVRLVGKLENNYYAVKHQNNGISSTLARFNLEGGELTLEQEIPLKLNSSHNQVVQTFFANQNTIVSLYFSNTNFFIAVCKLDENGIIESCNQKPLLSDYTFSIQSNFYKFFNLEGHNTFLFASNRTLQSSDGIQPKAFIFEFDQNINDLVLVQEMLLPEEIESPGNYESVNTAYTINNGKDLIVGFSKASHYYIDEVTQEWVASGFKSKFTYPQEAITYTNDNYFINRAGAPYLYDKADKSFNKTNQIVNTYNSWFQLTSNKHGFFIDISATPQISTFTLSNTTPAIYKGGIPTDDIYIIQDKTVEINIGQYFLNASGIEVTGFNNSEIHEKLVWDGEFIRGTLTNDDMFYNGYLNDPKPADDFQARVYFENNLLAYFYLIPTNVNDVPILLEQIETEYMKVGDAYSGNLQQIVRDPDRESVSFTYKSVPTGLSAQEDGTISGIINKSGTYTMTIIATDNDGAQLSFDLTIVVNSSGASENNSTSSGGGSFGFTLLAIVFLLYRRYQ